MGQSNQEQQFFSSNMHEPASTRQEASVDTFNELNFPHDLFLMHVIAGLICLTLVFFLFCKYWERFVSHWAMSRHRGSLSDEERARSISARRQIEEEKKLDSPELRKSKLIANFEKNQVLLVRTAISGLNNFEILNLLIFRQLCHLFDNNSIDDSRRIFYQ